jgi:hypothetical protein
MGLFFACPSTREGFAYARLQTLLGRVDETVRVGTYAYSIFLENLHACRHLKRVADVSTLVENREIAPVHNPN